VIVSSLSSPKWSPSSGQDDSPLFPPACSNPYGPLLRVAIVAVPVKALSGERNEYRRGSDEAG